MYAIGEIALVVIGILIALNINNWNEDRIAHNTLTEKLKSQVKVRQADRVRLQSNIDIVTFRIYGIKRVLELASIPTN
ncbi:hypothetical protein ACOCEA_14275 [Maribacter sp. CXY002]|uniref:hypothetical protein n=1 Tax=Maribacter luteocoastalis TaxID=3407671 RepID=UPI003B67FC4D